MIDMHCHVIPQVDDGSKSMEESIQIIKEAKKSGFSGIFATPHYFGEQSLNRENILKRLQILKEELKNRKIAFELFQGNEIYLCEDIYTFLSNDKVSTLNNKKYMLVELPRKNRVLDLNNLLFKLVANGYVPIIAHPERYDYIQENPNELLSISELGVLFQINFPSLLGNYGAESEKTAKILLNHGFVSFIGSDAHRSGFAFKNMKKVIAIMNKYAGKEQVERILNRNPIAVVNGDPIKKNVPEPYVKKMMDFMKY